MMLLEIKEKWDRRCPLLASSYHFCNFAGGFYPHTSADITTYGAAYSDEHVK